MAKAKEAEEKVNPILVKDESGNVKYTLEFSRDSVKWAERRGFKITEVADYPMTGIPQLFFYAFRMHHKGITQEMTDSILDEIGATPALMERLTALYSATMETLIGENEVKNGKWAVEF